ADVSGPGASPWFGTASRVGTISGGAAGAWGVLPPGHWRPWSGRSRATLQPAQCDAGRVGEQSRVWRLASAGGPTTLKMVWHVGVGGFDGETGSRDHQKPNYWAGAFLVRDRVYRLCRGGEQLRSGQGFAWYVMASSKRHCMRFNRS